MAHRASLSKMFSGLDTPVKIVAAIFMLVVSAVGTGWGVKVGLDTTYAGAADTRQKFDSLQQFLTKKDLRDLKRERGVLEREQEAGGLSKYEKGRLKEIIDEIGALEKEVNPGKK